MQSFWRLLGYLRRYRSNVVLAIVSNILTAVFTVISIPLLIPFLEILFDRTEKLTKNPGPFSFSNAEAWLNYNFSQFISSQGPETALIYVCIAI